MDELSLLRHVERRPEQLALIDNAGQLSWAELATAVDAARRALDDEPVTVLCEGNSRALLLKILALFELRRPFALLHPRLTAPERAEQRAHVLAHAEAIPDGTAVILFTSGTSGRAKAACLSRAALIASARGSLQHMGADALARWMLCMPLCHIGGLSTVTRTLLCGRSLALEPQFDAARVLESASRWQISGTSLVPTQLRRVLETGRSLAPLGLVMLGGAATPPSLLDAALAQGITALCTYGMTESCGQVTLEPLSMRRAPASERSAGVPMGDSVLQVLRADGSPCAPLEVGRLHLSGSSLFSGYLGHPPATQPFESGDLALQDAQGRLQLQTRQGDLIVSGGENVYPLEVERVLLSRGHVQDALVFGRADEEWGEAVCVLLVANADGERAHQLEQLQQLAHAQLASFKRPKRYAWVEQLPQRPNGKIDRRGARQLDVELQPWPRAHNTTR